MNKPTIEIIPHRGALKRERSAHMDVLVRITPPPAEGASSRPPLNLGLVIDRSGSMTGARLQNAVGASIELVNRLMDDDRVSVTTFDDTVHVRVPSCHGKDRKSIELALRAIAAGGSTDLHQGWVEGGMEVSRYIEEGRLNRVIVLSDGHANVGLTDPSQIARNVAQLGQRGVSTSTMGVGDGYNEDLLCGMSESGDGNFYHIAQPDQISDILEFEMSGLAATFGLGVNLEIEPLAGVELSEVLNDLERTPSGALKLTNLVRGRTIEVVLRLHIPAAVESHPLCNFRLSWSDLEGESRHSQEAVLHLPRVPAARISEFPNSEEVAQRVALQESGKAQREAVKHIDASNLGLALEVVQQAIGLLQETPSSPQISQEIRKLRNLIKVIKSGNNRSARKEAYSGSYYSSKSIDPAGAQAALSEALRAGQLDGADVAMLRAAGLLPQEES